MNSIINHKTLSSSRAGFSYKHNWSRRWIRVPGLMFSYKNINFHYFLKERFNPFKNTGNLLNMTGTALVWWRLLEPLDSLEEIPLGTKNCSMTYCCTASQPTDGRSVCVPGIQCHQSRGHPSRHPERRHGWQVPFGYPCLATPTQKAPVQALGSLSSILHLSSVKLLFASGNCVEGLHWW